MIDRHDRILIYLDLRWKYKSFKSQPRKLRRAPALTLNHNSFQKRETELILDLLPSYNLRHDFFQLLLAPRTPAQEQLIVLSPLLRPLMPLHHESHNRRRGSRVIAPREPSIAVCIGFLGINVLDRPFFTRCVAQGAEDGVLGCRKGVDADVAVDRLGRVQENADDCFADVGEEGEIYFGGAVVVDEGFVRLEIEAEELNL